MVQPFGYVVCCLVLSYRRLATLFVLAAVAVDYEFSIRNLLLEMRTWFIIATVCMLLGLILIPFVYRRWMNMEMG